MFYEFSLSTWTFVLDKFLKIKSTLVRRCELIMQTVFDVNEFATHFFSAFREFRNAIKFFGKLLSRNLFSLIQWRDIEWACWTWIPTARWRHAALWTVKSIPSLAMHKINIYQRRLLISTSSILCRVFLAKWKWNFFPSSLLWVMSSSSCFEMTLKTSRKILNWICGISDLKWTKRLTNFVDLNFSQLSTRLFP